MKRYGINFKRITILICLPIYLLLIGCGNSGNYDNGSIIDSIYIDGYSLQYNGNVKLQKVMLNSDDMDEITDLYQEADDSVGYRDSLLIAEKYNQGLGVNAFAQDNLDTLTDRGLTIKDIKKTQLILNKSNENINAVLVEYKITEGFISTVPTLYISQLFIPYKNSIKVLSYITEDSSAHSSAVNMFKNIN